MLVLCLEELDRPAEALRQVEDLLSFDLVPKDRAWAEGRRDRLRALVPDEPVEPVEPDPAPAAPRAEPAVPSPTAGATLRPDVRGAAILGIAAGGGWQRLDRWNYGAIGVDLSGRLVGPLRLVGGVSLGVSEEAGCGQEPPEGEGPCRSLLTTGSVGLGVRAPSPVAPFFELRGLLVPQPGSEAYLPVQGGMSLGGGVEFGPDSWPVAPRIRAAFELLSPLTDGGGPTLGGRVLAEAVVRIGGSE